MNIKDFKVGQTVYVELTGNESRGKTREELVEEWEITKVGGKYIEAAVRSGGRLWNLTVFEYREEYKRFVNKTNICVDYVIYLSRQEVEEKNEKNRLFNEISRVFSGYGAERNLTIEKLRKIKEILSEAERAKEC